MNSISFFSKVTTMSVLVVAGFSSIVDLSAVYASTTAIKTMPWAAGVVSLENEVVLNEPKEDKVLVFFWGSWCDICKSALKNDLPKMEREIAGFAAIPITLDREVLRATKSLRENGIGYRSFRDAEKRLIKEWKVFGAPHWVVLKRTAGVWASVDGNSGWDANAARIALTK